MKTAKFWIYTEDKEYCLTDKVKMAKINTTISLILFHFCFVAKVFK